MSYKYMDAVWSDTTLKGSSRLVMLALAHHANKDSDTCWPSVRRLADMTRISTRQVQRILRTLTDAGYIEQLETGVGRGNTAAYRILGKGDIQSTKGDAIVSPFSDTEKVTSEAVKGDISREKVTSGTIKGDIAMSPEPIEPILEPIEEKERAREAAQTPPPGYTKVLLDSPYMPKGMVLPRGFVPAGTGTNAVQVYYERFQAVDVNQRLNMPQQDDLAATCTDLDKLREVVIAYSRAGYKPRNINLILDWYKDGVPDRSHKNRSAQNGSYRRNGRGDEKPATKRSATDEYTPEQIEQIRQFRRSVPATVSIAGAAATF